MNTLSFGDPGSCKRDYQAARINIFKGTEDPVEVSGEDTWQAVSSF